MHPAIEVRWFPGSRLVLLSWEHIEDDDTAEMMRNVNSKSMKEYLRVRAGSLLAASTILIFETG